MMVEPLTGGEGRLMLIIDLSDSGLEAYQAAYLERLQSFSDSKDSFLTPLQLSLEGNQILAVTQLPVQPVLSEQPRLTVGQGEQLLNRLLIKLSIAQKQELNPSCFQSDSLYVTSQDIQCNALAAVARVMETEPEKDGSQIARSVIQAITGLRVSADSLDSFWQAEINLENPQLRQLLDDLLSGRITWAEAALTQLRNSQASKNPPNPTRTDTGTGQVNDSSLPKSVLKQPIAVSSSSSYIPSSSASTTSQSPASHEAEDKNTGCGFSIIFILFTLLVGCGLFAYLQSPGLQRVAVSEQQPSEQPSESLPSSSQTDSSRFDLSRDQAVSLVNQWLSKKGIVFAPPYDVNAVSSIITGALWQDLNKSDGPVNWLRNNNSYYQYGQSQVKEVVRYDTSGNRPRLTVRVYEERTLYTPNGTDPNQSGITDATFTYEFASENSTWMIADYHKD